ncbi:MAG: SAM-dependent chlorinase/fluorinase [Chloroflexota bacterium]
MASPVAFLSDFGLRDSYVGVVKGVIAGICPEAAVIDVTHGIAPGDVRAGAFELMRSARYFPKGTVFLAVVDPGVGTEREGVAVAAGGYRFVGPDNGLLSWSVREVAGGEAIRAIRLRHPAYWLDGVSTTFHGRDVFGPVAARLACGLEIGRLGGEMTSIMELPFPSVQRDAGELRGEILYVDGYGNLITNVRHDEVPLSPVVMVGGATIQGLSRTYQDGEGLVALIGSHGFLEIAVPNGSAAAVLGVGVGETVECRTAR